MKRACNSLTLKVLKILLCEFHVTIKKIKHLHMKNIFKTVIIIAIASLTACTQNNFDSAEYTTGTKVEPKVTLTTIAQLKDNFIEKNWQYFGADLISFDTQLVINGIVTSSDIEGNIYKYIVVKEEEPGGQAIRVSVDAAGLASIYPIGQRVSVILNDLYIGQYGQCAQVGIFGRHRTRGSEPEQTAPIPFPIARNQIIAYGNPEPSAVVPDTMTIKQILDSDKDVMSYRLVYIKNAHFTGNGELASSGTSFTPLSGQDKIFAPGTGGLNYPQSREINDGTGSIHISSSEFAKFSRHPLPPSSYVGDITAIVGWYNNRDISLVSNKAKYYQLTMRTLGDLGKGFEGYLEAVNYKK